MLQIEKLSIATTQKREIVDIGLKINEILGLQTISDGVCFVFLQDTTASITTGYIDPKWDLRQIEVFEMVNTILPAPNGQNDKGVIDHKHISIQIPEHVIASFIGTSLTVPIKDGRLNLGTDQAVILIELAGPKERSIIVDILAA